MQRLLTSVLSFGVALALAGCSSPAPAPKVSSDPTPSVAASLIPTAPPSDVVDVDSTQFAGEFGDYTFKIGDGPAWCTINVNQHSVICEQSEADANYAPIPVPTTCDYSYGYQVQLFSSAPTDGTKVADFLCSGGAYADATNAGTLKSGERVTLDGISCYTVGTAARCENAALNYIVLGPDAWALGG